MLTLNPVPKTFSKCVIQSLKQWLEDLSVNDLDEDDILDLESIAEQLIDLGVEFWGEETDEEPEEEEDEECEQCPTQ